MHKIQAVLFDLDNTLVDFLKMKQAATQAAVRAMMDAGLNVKEEKAVKMLFKMYHQHGFENQRIFNKFLKKINGTEDMRILAAGIAAYRKTKTGHIVTYPHTRKTLIALKGQGMQLGIVSDAPKLQAWTRLAELNLMEFFDTVIAVGGTGKEKPHKAPYLKASQALNVKPEHILFVGDNPDRDIKGAKRLGMKTALAKYGQIIKGKTKPNYVLKDIADLLTFVK